MAALIVDSCGSVCTSICTLPCTLCKTACVGCGELCKGCNGICRGCSEACSGVCRGCAQACGGCCKAFSAALCSPFAPYLIVATVLNVPVAVWGFRKAWMDEGSACRQQTLWLWVNGALALLNVVAALYIVVRVQHSLKDLVGSSSSNSPPTATAVPVGNDDTSNKSMRSLVQIVGLREARQEGSRRGRLRKVLCYDPLVATYLLVGFCWMGWVFYGIVTLVGGATAQCEDSDIIVSSITCGILFVVLALCTIPCAFLCLN